nr:PhzF family isomerase [Saccharothrix mutabilis subsp. capreolus]
MRTLYQVDSFTRTPFTGNPAGVVLDAEGMTEHDMQAVARELNNSETAFVLPADGDDHDVRVRFFTPTTEVPTCGHATVAAHYARTVEYGLPAGSLVQKTGTGLLQRIDVSHEDGIHIAMRQGEPEFGPELTGAQADRLVRALGVHTRDLPGSPIQIVSTGHSKVLVELKSRHTVDALAPDMAALTNLSRAVGSNGFMIFTRDTGHPDLLTWSRMFAPAIGITEDPVTGNGHGPLGAYLAHHDLAPLTGGALEFTGRQGVAMGRPGDVRVRVVSAGGLEVTISGEAVIAFRGELAERPVE